MGSCDDLHMIEPEIRYVTRYTTLPITGLTAHLTIRYLRQTSELLRRNGGNELPKEQPEGLPGC
jgi:hypothetical protein